jgi:hypothetical protein
MPERVSIALSISSPFPSQTYLYPHSGENTVAPEVMGSVLQIIPSFFQCLNRIPNSWMLFFVLRLSQVLRWHHGGSHKAQDQR